MSQRAVDVSSTGPSNTDGGTLLIGVRPDRTALGLELDYAQVKPANADGFVNWLTQLLVDRLGSAAAMRTRARVLPWDSVEICRPDVAASSEPVWAWTSEEPGVFFVRMNSSSRALPAGEIASYVADRWPGRASGAATPVVSDFTSDA